MFEFSLVEKIILLIVVAAAAGGFIALARTPYRIIREGKPEPDRTGDTGRRIGRVIREVLFQRRVLGGRPVVGFLHASVFLAFLLFSIETVNMFLEPFGLGFIHALFGGALGVFRIIVMTAAAVCSLSMVGLVIRRFFMKSISPDPRSYESGFVALLIVLLMLTYIDMFGTHLAPEKANWWLHGVIILGFPALILNSKHRHIFLAPVAVFLRKGRLWEVEKMNLDFEAAESEDDIQLGLETLADIPWKLRLDFFSCVECRRCTDNCPAAQAGQELRPADFIIAGRNALLNGKPDDPVLGTVISEKAIGQCTSCMACENVCPVGVEHSQLLAGVKAMQTLALGTGVATEFHKTMTNHMNPFSAGQDVRNALIADLKIPYFDPDTTDYLLWLGCVWSYNQDFKKVVGALAELLKRGGVSFGVLKSEQCSGHHSRKQGEEMQFQMLAEENAGALKSNNVRKIVTGCPHCLNTIRHDYADFLEGHEVSVVHHSELLLQLVSQGKLKIKPGAAGEIKATYHDPCYLGRYEHVLDEPRSLIRATGGTFIETEQNRQYSYCCGGGAAGFTLEAKEGKRVDQVRKEHIKATGADTLITSCPECKMMLDGTLDTTRDISEFLMDVLEK